MLAFFSCSSERLNCPNSGPVSLAVEHPGIGRVLVHAGLGRLPDATSIDGSTIVPLLIAWSDRETLSLQPEYAWLSLSEINFIRLPVSLFTLRSAIDAAAQSGPSEQMANLLTATPELRWSLETLRSEIEAAELGRGRARLIEIERFARTKWPGWYERMLHELSESVQDRERAVKIIQLLIDRCVSVDEIEACRPLLSWQADESKQTRLAVLQDCLAYSRQGLLPLETLLEHITRDQWWDDFESDLLITEKGVTPGSYLANCIITLRRRIGEIRNVEKQLSEGSSDDLHAAAESIDGIAETLREVTRLKDQTRASLLSDVFGLGA
jgi:hypothetical protein